MCLVLVIGFFRMLCIYLVILMYCVLVMNGLDVVNVCVSSVSVVLLVI